MSSIKNWCVCALPVAAMLLGCGSVDDSGHPTDTSELDKGAGQDLAAIPALAASGTLTSQSVGTGLVKPPVGNPQCEPANPQACNQAKHEEPSPPPASLKLTGCTIQVLMETVTAASGQGATEGNMEMSALASSGGDSLRWPDSGEIPIAVGDSKHIEEAVAEYQLKPKEKRMIDICTTFTEDDDGGTNGSSDVGEDCENIEISCKMAVTGAVTVDLSAPLCMGNERDEFGVCQKYNGEASAQFRVSVSDEDWDNVPNDEDATPLPEDEACRGQEGRAVVLFLDFGTSDLNDLIGIVGMGVDNFVDDYDFVAIATDPLNVAGFTLREDTLANADMVVPPTLEGLMDAFRVATSEGFDITFLDLGHGGADAFDEAFFSSADPAGAIFESSLSASLSPEQFGTCAVPFRAVNSLACYFGHMNSMWIDRGAKVAGGKDLVGFFPQELNGFVRRWNNGDTFGASSAGAFDPVVRTLNRLAIEAVGFVTDPNCGASVLGLNGCASQFFTTAGPSSMSFSGNGRNDYAFNLSGRTNMDLGSADVIAGNPGIDKFTPLTW